MFSIDTDEDTIKDCIMDLIDNTDDLNEDSNDNSGEFIIKMKRLRHKSIEEVKEDIKDAFSKLSIIDADFYFIFVVIKPLLSMLVEQLTLKLPKTSSGGKPADIDSWFKLNDMDGKEQNGENQWCKPDNIKSISLHIYNPQTHLPSHNVFPSLEK